MRERVQVLRGDVVMRASFSSLSAFSTVASMSLRIGTVTGVVLGTLGAAQVDLRRTEAVPSPPSPSRVIHVRVQAEGAEDGTSWRDAFRDLNAALASAAAGDQIRVAAGTYRATDGRERRASFVLLDGVTILGGFAGIGPDPDLRDPLLYPTILSGNIGDPESSEDDSHHVLTAGPDVSPATVVDGFVVERGNAEGAQPLGGGGIYAAGSPTVRRCTFRENRAEAGGATYVDLGGPVFLDCSFVNNHAWAGGAVYARGGATRLINVEVTGNRAERGGAAVLEFGVLELVNATISGNLAERGGSVLWLDGGTAVVHNSIVWGNLPAGSPFAGLDPVVAYSDVEGGFPGEGNLKADPRFRNPAGGDYRLGPGSASIDAGSDALIPAFVTTDRGGLPRRAAGRESIDARVDQGAWEVDGSVPEETVPEQKASATVLLADSDGDGAPDETDCRPLDGSVWAAPSPARDLLLEGKSSTTLSWRLPAAPGGTSVRYDVLRATSPSGFDSALCFASDLSATSITDSSPVPASFYYLVRAKNACGDTLGNASSPYQRTGPGCSATGQPCASDLACTSGFCTDGYCCDLRCSASCESCAEPGLVGTCAAIPWGTDPADECPTDPQSTCGRNGVCSGLRTCELWPEDTVCNPAGCASTSQMSLADTCNGAGTCRDGGVADCDPYICDPSLSACRSSCTTPDHCWSGDCCMPSCVDTSSDPAHCGACGLACTNPHGSTSCTGYQCTPVCDANWDSCDSDPNDGCETSLTTETNCGACGVACSLPNASVSCSTGTCQMTGCEGAFSNCDGNTANGCELNHHTYYNACATAEYVGTYAGDSVCGFICPAVGWTQFATRTGTTGKWFHVFAQETSACVGKVEHRIRLASPAGTDYDLCVYTGCGSQPNCSRLGMGAVDEVTIYKDDNPLTEEDYYYWVEVLHFSGSSCSGWTLTFDGHHCP